MPSNPKYPGESLANLESAPTRPPAAREDKSAAVTPLASVGNAASATVPPRTDSVDPTPLRSSPAGYDILAELGRGGMGVVYQARQNALQRTVALKMILGGGHASPADLARFRTEAESIARLQHPHIVQIYEIGEYDGLPYFSLEFCGGGSLDKKLAATPLPAHDAAALLEKLAHAVQAAHNKGVIHRDLKPANVLLQIPDNSDKSAICNLQSAIPKITDFGLAKRLESDPGVSTPGAHTQTGAVMGTPSYMAPEQAGGKSKELGPACDIYALGAVLYECLTGRPPFKAATPLDTLLQVVSEEPVPPTRLNRKVPRDLETICLKCLAKHPARRYGSAAALAQDLGRFQSGEPIRARPVGWVERSWSWCRRKPALSGMLAAVSLLVVALVVGAFWYVQDQADRSVRAAQAEQKQLLAEQGIGQALDQAREWRNALQQKLRQHGGVFELLNHPEDWQARIQMAQATLDRATALLASADEGMDPALKARAGQLERLLQADETDRLLAMRLEKIRLDQAAWVEGRFDNKKAGEDYPRAFGVAGLAVVSDDLARVVKRIRSMPIKEQVLAALDNWAQVTFELGNKDGNKELLERLLAVARAVAPDAAWGDRLRQLSTWLDQEALSALANKAPAARLSPQLLFLVGVRLHEDTPLKETWLRQAQAQFPGDYWLNFELAIALRNSDPVESAGFCRVALALRPATSAAYTNLGAALDAQQKLPEAIDAFRKAIALDPKNTSAYVNLGNALHGQQKLPEAIAAYHKAIEIDPKFASAYRNLGIVLNAQQKLAEAIVVFRKAIQLDPEYALAYYSLGNGLADQNKLPEAIAAYHQAIALDPKYAPFYNNLAHAFLEQNKLPQAIAACRKAIALDPHLANAYYNLGRALYAQQKPSEAIGAFCKTVELDPKNALAYYYLAKALRDQKKLPEAIAAYHKAIEINPTLAEAHCNLGFALLAQGEMAQGLAALRRGDELGRQQADWRYPSASWVQRAERLAKLERNLPAILTGKQQPASAGESIQYAQVSWLGLYAAAARFYEQAFAAEPKLAEDLKTGNRYNAACAAALAGAGQGKDSAKLDDQQRAHWRRQAVAWLNADLVLWAKQLASGKAQDRATVQRTLRHWQEDTDLAGIREAAALAKLPAAEQAACQELWADVRKVLKDAQAR